AVGISVRAATTINIALSGLLTVDGVALKAGDRVLVKDQKASAENGIYTATKGVWLPGADLSGAGREAGGIKIKVLSGNANGDLYYVIRSAYPFAIELGQPSVAEIVLRDGAPRGIGLDQIRLRELRSLQEFGATCDGATDDLPSLKAALKHAAEFRLTG